MNDSYQTFHRSSKPLRPLPTIKKKSVQFADLPSQSKKRPPTPSFGQQLSIPTKQSSKLPNQSNLPSTFLSTFDEQISYLPTSTTTQKRKKIFPQSDKNTTLKIGVVQNHKNVLERQSLKNYLIAERKIDWQPQITRLNKRHQQQKGKLNFFRKKIFSDKEHLSMIDDKRRLSTEVDTKLERRVSQLERVYDSIQVDRYRIDQELASFSTRVSKVQTEMAESRLRLQDLMNLSQIKQKQSRQDLFTTQQSWYDSRLQQTSQPPYHSNNYYVKSQKHLNIEQIRSPLQLN